MTQLIDRKLDRAFRQIDFDGNGVIERDDLVGMGSRLLSAFGEPATSPKGTAVMAGVVTFWTELSAAVDIDGDDRITPEEYQRGMVSTFVDNPTAVDRAFRPMVEAMAGLLDTDADGTISISEYVAALDVLGTAGPEAREAFSRLDVDGDGALTVDELVAGSVQFYTGTDPDAPGNLMFGQV
ncbi:hypothetical protein Lfu02_63430 [Longispora fulva]|uniref:Ca2+-binding EF-hand superfamily protein n=1 Tax=Longispora fulva TaxID=619741 RepID=A0A8J7KE52_9ACTN|nr:EF-hand domain-containing protein [Longispora fulva]MBG6134760.1 Ca2+-binding EF-hand superfamily protein [Longispora fulva]GIG61971.1 hypothetical protein Lfu02_63430 [Longispora fulva]